MARLVYGVLTSLDGYIGDAEGSFDWAEPDEEVHAFVNDKERAIGTYLYGRRLYEVMLAWETWPSDDQSAISLDYAQIWRAADKVVYSKTLDTVSSARTRLEREFDPEAVRQMKESSDRDLGIGGAHLGAQALRAGLVDGIQVYLSPVVVGGGTSALPDDLRLDLELRDERRFDNGVVYLDYDVKP